MIERHDHNDGVPSWQLDEVVEDAQSDYEAARELVRSAGPDELAAAIVLRSDAHRTLCDRLRSRRIIAAGTVSG